jgi:hypothetical protein
VVQDAEAHDAGGQRRPGVHDHAEPVITDPQPTQPLEPADRPLDGLIANDKFCLIGSAQLPPRRSNIP